YMHAFHPDIVEANYDIRDAGARVSSTVTSQVATASLDQPWREQSLLLIGGPKSNELSLEWREVVIHEGRIVAPKRPTRGCRWDVVSAGADERTQIARYVGGKLVVTEPKA